MNDAKRQRLVFVFSGQGPRWPGTGREIFEKDELFQEEVLRCEELISELADWRLTNEIFRPEGNSRRDDTDVAQPAHFAFQVALAKCLNERGLFPDAVIGHSMGEVAAAYVAGVLDLPDAVKVIYHRGLLTQITADQGRMVWLDQTAQATTELLESLALRQYVSVTAVNEPDTSVIGGGTPSIDVCVRALKERNIRHSLLGFRYGFHSPLMDPYQAEFAELLRGIRPRGASLPIVSTVTGDHLDGTHFDGAYWSRNLRETVHFADGVEKLIECGASVFLEIGPHALLTGSVEACLLHGSHTATVAHTLYRGRSDIEELKQAVREVRSVLLGLAR